jgi:hypothetical protein
MSRQVRVNVATLVNASKIRREKRAGRDVIIVPSATLPDDIVMHGSGGRIRYPAKVIAESFHTLEGRPAPLGHPSVNGQYVSASSPDGIIRGFIGAHNENVRRENGRVLLDKVLDVEFANQSDRGRAVLNAIEKEEPIHTSTGMLAMLNALKDDPEADFEAESMILDHDCLLLDKPGAATPEQGVGIFVNAAGDEIDVINCTLADDIDRDIGWSVEGLLRGLERKERLSLIERIKRTIAGLVQGGPTLDTIEGTALNAEHEAMDKAQFDELSGKVETLSGALSSLDDKITTAVGNALKPMLDAQAARDAADKAKADADHAALVNQVVEAELLTEELAAASPVEVLNALLAKDAGPKAAFRVNSAFKPTGKATDIAALAPKGE